MSDDDLTGGKDFLGGYLNIPGAEYKVQGSGGRGQYDLGRSLGRQNDMPRSGRVRAVTEADRQQARSILRISLVLGMIGALAGFGYGSWQVFAVGTLSAGGPAMTLLTWTGIGAGVGALLPVALIVGLVIGSIVAILLGLGFLLNFLTSL